MQIYISVVDHRGTFRAINFKRLRRRPRYELEDKVDQREVKLLIARTRNVGRGWTGLSGPTNPGFFSRTIPSEWIRPNSSLIATAVASTARDIRNGYCRSQTETSAMVRGVAFK